MKQPDMLLVMSDQHAARYTGYDGGMADTPNLDAMAAEGTRFDAHYTSCPLCVPARMSFVSGALPTRIGVTNNRQTIPETRPTFLFPLVEAGYETVLIGRMHFIGKDLRHGFMRRIGGDMTPTCWSLPHSVPAAEKGDLYPAFASSGEPKIVGGGESPVIYYDREIVRLALEYLACPHDKPQFIVVGTFGPHSPLVAPPDLYLKYRERNYLPPDFHVFPDFVSGNPWLASHRFPEISDEQGRKAAAAYCALIEQTDGYIGQLRSAFCTYTKRAGHAGVFGYTSDHGDMIGSRKMYGKQTFFEDSVRVPLVLTGDGIPAGRIITDPTGIMDLGPTFCELAGTSYEGRFVDGISLTPMLAADYKKGASAHPVISQLMETAGRRPEGKISYAVMVREGKWKYIRYHGSPDTAVLFDMEKDPDETVNRIERCPEIAKHLNDAAEQTADAESAEQEHRERMRMSRWLAVCEAATGTPDLERWKDNPETARGQLAVE